MIEAGVKNFQMMKPEFAGRASCQNGFQLSINQIILEPELDPKTFLMPGAGV